MGNEAVAGLKILKPKHLNLLLERKPRRAHEKLIRFDLTLTAPGPLQRRERGVFGLASLLLPFTAPIRRYSRPGDSPHSERIPGPGRPAAEAVERLQSRSAAIALHASERERAAMEAERASMDQKSAHMEGKIGEVFSGISGVAGFGIFVELENTDRRNDPGSRFGR